MMELADYSLKSSCLISNTVNLVEELVVSANPESLDAIVDLVKTRVEIEKQRLRESKK